ncbi:MAG: Hpt domain-containing protein [Luminiphilus sp.]
MDLSEVQDVFFEECLEGLDVLESGLLNLDQSTDIEEINAIFRAAHSIKGGAGTFGFPEISAFTHVMETLLDEMRDGRRAIEREAVDRLLASVDVLRGMVDAAQEGVANDEEKVQEVQSGLEELLAQTADGSASASSETTAETPAADTAEQSGVWEIDFAPGPEMLKRGNEPVRIFRELSKLGELEARADSSNVPGLAELDPRCCHLRWQLVLTADVTQEAIEELFAWVEDECELSVKPAGGGQQAAAEQPATANDVATDAADPAAASADTATSAPAPKSKTPEPAAKAAPGGAKGQKDGGSIRVGIDKVDDLINLVGELVITQSMLTQVSEQFEAVDSDLADNLRDGIAQLERNTRELQQNVLKIRMLPITVSFSRFPRLVRQGHRAANDWRTDRSRQDGAGKDQRPPCASGSQLAGPRH